MNRCCVTFELVKRREVGDIPDSSGRVGTGRQQTLTLLIERQCGNWIVAFGQSRYQVAAIELSNFNPVVLDVVLMR